MIGSQQKQQNWLINVMRLFFAIGILAMHVFSQANCKLAFYTFCEAFFIISGIYLYKSATTKNISTFKYVFLKWWKLLPALLCGAIVSIISKNVDLYLQHTWNWTSFGWSIFGFIFEIVPIIGTKLNDGNIWFICGLLWASLILFPIVKKINKKCSTDICVYSICISIFIYAIVFSVQPFVEMFPNEKIILSELCYTIRAIASMSIGIFIASLCEKINLNKISDKKKPIIWSIIFIVCFTSSIVVAVFKFHTRFDILIIALEAICIFIAYSKISYLNKKYTFDSKHFAGISLFVYTFHGTFFWLFWHNLKLPAIETGFIAFAFCLVIPTLIYFIYYILKEKWKVSNKKVI